MLNYAFQLDANIVNSWVLWENSIVSMVAVC